MKPLQVVLPCDLHEDYSEYLDRADSHLSYHDWLELRHLDVLNTLYSLAMGGFIGLLLTGLLAVLFW